MWVRIALYYIGFSMLLIFGSLFFALIFLGFDEFRRLAEGELPPDLGLTLLIRGCLAPIMMVMTVAFVHFFDHKPIVEVGAWWPAERRAWIRWDLAASLGGVALLTGLWWVLARLTGVTFERLDPAFVEGAQIAGPLKLALYAVGFLATAALYEQMLRGYVYSTLRERHTWVNASGLTALLFVADQMGNPEIEAAGLLVTFLLGLVLGAIRELTGSWWPAVLFHGGWNFAIGCVLSLPLSGLEMPSLYALEVSGDPRFSGGDYGPEGSWLMVPLLLGLLLLLAVPLGRREEEELEAAEKEESEEA